MRGTTIHVLDKGSVTLVDYMGGDLSVVNAARASYGKEKFELDEKDVRLIKFLAREGHTSPFRHATVSFNIKAPMMVARQWFKYRVGSVHSEDSAEVLGLSYNNGDDDGFDDSLHARNEASRRYITLDTEFYLPEPDEWRGKPANSKQGSGAIVPIPIGTSFSTKLLNFYEKAEALYEEALEAGICAEQARLFLPMYGLYTSWRWTTSLMAVAHFLNQRLEHDAQKEIQEYAKAVYQLVKPLFEHSIGELVKSDNKE
jgi:thymidylate synthase (FAD)